MECVSSIFQTVESAADLFWVVCAVVGATAGATAGVVCAAGVCFVFATDINNKDAAIERVGARDRKINAPCLGY